jgi:xylulokinase
MYLAGFDIGSSSVKLSIIDADTNKCVYSSHYPDIEMPMIAAQKGWAEQDPKMWWEAITILAQRAIIEGNLTAERIAAIGISYQMHGLVCVDHDMNLVRPSIIWCDSRAVPYGDAAAAALGAEYCHNHLLNSPGNFTAAKLAWVKDNEPAIYDNIYKVMLPGDYIAAKMSGNISTTVSGLSEGIFYDFKKDQLSSPLLNYFGFNPELIPEVLPTFSKQGQLSVGAAKEMNWVKGIPISYRAGDQPNNAFSLNVLSPGEVAATAGTSGVVYGITDETKADPASRVNSFAHVNYQEEAKRIGVLLCINGTGILYAWCKRMLQIDSYPRLNELANQVPIGSQGLRILPFGNGAERILGNRYIGSQCCGIDFNTHGPGHIARAAQEGIACSLKYGFDIMADMGVKSNVIRAGDANLFLSPMFREAVSALTGSEIQLYNTDGAQGAARGAGIGVGIYTLQNAFSGLEIIASYNATKDIADQYQTLYEDWKKTLFRYL